MRNGRTPDARGGKAPSARGGRGRRKARRKRAALGQSPGPGRERPQQDGQLRRGAQERRRGPAPLRKSAGPQRPPGLGEPGGPPARQRRERQRRAPPRDEPCATSCDRAPRWAAAPPVRPAPRRPPPTAPASECCWASTRCQPGRARPTSSGHRARRGARGSRHGPPRGHGRAAGCPHRHRSSRTPCGHGRTSRSGRGSSDGRRGGSGRCRPPPVSVAAGRVGAAPDDHLQFGHLATLGFQTVGHAAHTTVESRDPQAKGEHGHRQHTEAYSHQAERRR